MNKLTEILSFGSDLINSTDPTMAQSDYNYWIISVQTFIDKNCHNPTITADWLSLGNSALVVGNYYYDDPQTWLIFRNLVQKRLKGIGENLNLEKKDNNENHDFWSYISKEIVEISKEKFDAGFYADSVESALKYINSIIKNRVKELSGQEYDGASLMKFAFSSNNPYFIFFELNSISGRDEQLGYMEIFAGTMTGIRNPKAHGIINITKGQAVHFIFLASLLMNKFRNCQEKENA